MSWSQSPVLKKTIGPESMFRQVNAANKMEGGPKGVAVTEQSLAVCSPEHGIKIYSLRENFRSRDDPMDPSERSSVVTGPR